MSKFIFAIVLLVIAIACISSLSSLTVFLYDFVKEYGGGFTR